MAEGPNDLIRLEGEGNSVILRITGKETQAGAEVLAGEFLVDTGFVRGSLRTAVVLEDLWEWRDALDGLDAGHDIVWREYKRAPEMLIERDQDHERAHVTIRDHLGTLTTVIVTVKMADSWFDDAYERLDLVMKTWRLAQN
jgi:hypothetical protein